MRKQLKDAAAQGASTESLRDAFQAAQVPDAPVERRYLVNDSTVEKLGELLNQNHNGLLIFRDEIGGLLRSMEREGHENDRAFLCESWNGTGAYTYDRIGRGTQHIAACCLSVLGGIQPMPLGAYLHETFAAGQDDGLLQRFQLIAYPDVNPEWVNVDRWPDSDARRRVVELFRALDRVDHQAIGAHCEGLDLPFLRFTPEAQLRFDAWRAQLEHRLRDSGDHPAFVAHLAKYRSLVPSLALLFHLVECVDRGTGGPVSTDATDRAIAWTEYLEPHARRVYEPMVAPGRLATSTLARKMERGELASPFTVRDIRRKGWTGVAGPDANNAIFAALDQLESLAWLRRESVKRSDGGRPTVLYHINPAIVRPER